MLNIKLNSAKLSNSTDREHKFPLNSEIFFSESRKLGEIFAGRNFHELKKFREDLISRFKDFSKFHGRIPSLFSHKKFSSLIETAYYFHFCLLFVKPCFFLYIWNKHLLLPKTCLFFQWLRRQCNKDFFKKKYLRFFPRI